MINEEPQDGGLGNQLLDEAAEWFALMRGPDARNHKDAFDAWMVRGALHRAAYNRIAEIFTDSGRVENRRQDKVHKIGSRRRALIVIAAVSLCTIVTAILFIISGPSERQRPFAAKINPKDHVADKVLTSRIGEIRRIALADGTALILDTDSMVTTELTRTERRLRLLRGRARFDVAHEARPFHVAAGNGMVTAHGTVFDVRLDTKGSVAVSLIKGAIDVELPVAKGKAIQRLSPGERTSYDQKFIEKQPVAERERAYWTEARGEFHDVALGELIAEANRYSLVPIVVTDPSIDMLRVSGIFSFRNSDELSLKLAQLFDLTRQPDHDRILLGRTAKDII